jgi:choline kinase
MQAVIVAAGRSSRLYPLTNETPKCLLEIAGISLIQRAINLLNVNGVRDIVVVVGFHHQKIRDALNQQVRFVFNPFFAQTNNMGSLWMAMASLKPGDFIYLHADVIFHERLMAKLVNRQAEGDIDLLVDFQSIDEEAMKVRVNHGRFIESSKEIPLEQAAGEWTGLARIAARGKQPLLAAMETILEQGGFQEYDTAAFNRLIRQGVSFGLAATDGLPWCEIDTPADLAKARKMFEKD